jgi:flagellar export protein FliJ
MAPKFSLQNVLDVRHRKVELFEIELGKLMAAQQEAEQQLVSLRAVHDDLLEQLNAAQCGDIDLLKISWIRLNIVQVNSYIENVILQLMSLNKQVEDKRGELVKAKQSEETLEILKRKRHESYLAEQVEIEARIQDDIYIARAFRNQQQGV